MRLFYSTLLLITIAVSMANAGVRGSNIAEQKSVQNYGQYQTQKNQPVQCTIRTLSRQKCIVKGVCGNITMANCELGCGGGCSSTFFDEHGKIIGECTGGLPSREMVRKDAESGRNMFIPNCLPRGWTCNADPQPAYTHCSREHSKTHQQEYSY